MNRARYVVLKLESYTGLDTYVQCGKMDGEQDHLYCVAEIADDGSGHILDAGYRTYTEAVTSWPEAKPRHFL